MEKPAENSSQQYQEEFLSQFLPYASKRYQRSRPGLYQTARDVLSVIFELSNSRLPEFTEAIIKPQKSSGHILLSLDDQFHILIQHHASTQPSNEKLTAEIHHLLTNESVRLENIYPVILKTQYEFTVDMDQLIYPMMSAQDLLPVLFGEQTKGITNKQFNEYRLWLAEADQEFSGFRVRQPAAWGYKEWIGYSNFMEEEMSWGSWEYRPDGAEGRFEFIA